MPSYFVGSAMSRYPVPEGPIESGCWGESMGGRSAVQGSQRRLSDGAL